MSVSHVTTRTVCCPLCIPEKLIYGTLLTSPPRTVGRPLLQVIKVNVKVQFTLKQATKTQKGSRGIALLFL
jgi:hypothetical protein